MQKKNRMKQPLLFTLVVMSVSVLSVHAKVGLASGSSDKKLERSRLSEIPAKAVEDAFGGLATDAARYNPLDVVTVHIRGRTKGDTRYRIRVCDPGQHPYWETNGTLNANHGTARFQTGGQLGTHYIYLTWPGEKSHSRYINFRLDCETGIRSGDEDFDQLYPLTRDAMLRARREYSMGSGLFVGYVSGDSSHFDGVWLRDWIYGLPAYRYWESEMTCGIDRFLEHQYANGMIPDGIERNGRTWRVGLESDVEYIMVLAVWQTWQATGNDAWMRAALPALERALRYIQNDENHWDQKYALVKRQHSCDTWDFDIDDAPANGDRRHVIATCDQSGYVQAYEAMSRMFEYLNMQAQSSEWQAIADAYRKRANALLWDGTKYRHHVHLDKIDHGNFDEAEQLAMGNTWAMTRGLAMPEQARSIIDEYRRRHQKTGDAFPWWSLQPGYPDHLGYFPSHIHCRQGGYANGGLMPWVGGELCRAAFRFGRETYGTELLREYIRNLKRRGGSHVWYWLNGEPGFRTTNEVPYAPWGMAEWLNAALEGLAGVHDDFAQLRVVTVSPRWAASAVHDVRVAVRFASSKAYLSYTLRIDHDANAMRLSCTGSGSQRRGRVLLPQRWVPVNLTQAENPIPYVIEEEDASRYVCFSMDRTWGYPFVIQCKKVQSHEH